MVVEKICDMVLDGVDYKDKNIVEVKEHCGLCVGQQLRSGKIVQIFLHHVLKLAWIIIVSDSGMYSADIPYCEDDIDE